MLGNWKQALAALCHVHGRFKAAFKLYLNAGVGLEKQLRLKHTVMAANALMKQHTLDL
jgi:hypothetical protein